MNYAESLFETDDATVDIETTADVLKPVIGHARKLVTELKLHASDDGLHYRTVDGANVAMMSVDVPAACFERYDVDETTIGLDLKKTMGALRLARQSEPDGIALNYADEMLNTSVQRDYDGTTLDLEHSHKTLEPESIRDEPDDVDIDWSGTATLSRDLFGDVVETIGTVTGYHRFVSDGDDLVIAASDDLGASRAVVEGVLDGGPADSTLSGHYLETALSAFAAIGAEELTLSLGEDIPMRIDWSVELGGESVTGYWMQAPRVGGDE